MMELNLQEECAWQKQATKDGKYSQMVIYHLEQVSSSREAKHEILMLSTAL